MGIRGLETLQQTLQEVQSALADLDGNIAKVSFDPDDPASIEHAIQQFCSAVDERLSRYAHNETIVAVAKELKDAGRGKILERAAAARLESGENE